MMDKTVNKNSSIQKSEEKKKKPAWQKPTFITIRQEELAEYIKVAARSSGGGCTGTVGR